MGGAQLISPKLLETMFKAIIVRHRNSKILLVHDGQRLALLNVTIVQRTRATPEIRSSTLQTYDPGAVTLFDPEPQNGLWKNGDPDVFLIPKDSSWQPAPGGSSVSQNELQNHFDCTEGAQMLEGASRAWQAGITPAHWTEPWPGGLARRLGSHVTPCTHQMKKGRP